MGVPERRPSSGRAAAIRRVGVGRRRRDGCRFGEGRRRCERRGWLYRDGGDPMQQFQVCSEEALLRRLRELLPAAVRRAASRP